MRTHAYTAARACRVRYCALPAGGVVGSGAFAFRGAAFRDTAGTLAPRCRGDGVGVRRSAVGWEWYHCPVDGAHAVGAGVAAQSVSYAHTVCARTVAPDSAAAGRSLS